MGGIGIRDVILGAILVVSLPLSVMRPFFGLLVFSWLAYMRPNDMTWGINQFRPSLCIAVATLVGVILHRRERMVVLEKRTVLLGIFLAAVGVSALMAPDPVFAFRKGNLEDLAKVLFIALLTTGLVTTRDRARWLLLVIGMSLGFLALKAAVQGVLNPGTKMHGPGGAILDNNDFGLALVMALPLLAYLARDEKGPFLKATLVAMAVSCVAGVLFTQSRGGVVALGAMGLFWAWKLRRNGWAMILAPLAVALVLVVSPPELWVRVRNLATGATDASAQGRVVAWQKGVNMIESHPAFGIGPGYFDDPVVWSTTPPHDLPGGDKPLVAHNTYIQIGAESGLVALAVFVLLMVVTLVSLARTKIEPDDPWRSRYADAIFLSLIGFLAGSFFLTRTHFDLTYHLIGISVAIAVATKGTSFDWFGIGRFFRNGSSAAPARYEGRGV